MHSTAIERRAFLRGACAAGLMLFGGMGARPASADEAEPLYLSACRKPDGSFAAAMFRADTGLVRTVALPEGVGADAVSAAAALGLE